MGRLPCCDKNGVKKGPWTPEDDQKLIDYIQVHGPANWRNLPKNAGLQRCGKSCRLRWTNYLRPDIKRGRFSIEEEETIIDLHRDMGNKWSAIAAHLPGRTDNEIKNHWNTHIRKRLLSSGIDPVTHSPRLDLLDVSSLLATLLFNRPNLESSVATHASSLFSLDVLRLASLLLPSQQKSHNIYPTHASNIDQKLQNPVTSVSSQPQADAISTLEPLNVGFDGGLPHLWDSLDLESLMSTPKSSQQHNSIDFGFTLEDFMLI